ncbi:MAG: Lrp/AsnC family transcriptional regulator [Chloroflexi bacterium]|jgi:DNA-binding Lrp family transcriptional regulator|nr:Lrp/AsnC family transcriptional regulator [Chloroflexota bacterium]
MEEILRILENDARTTPEQIAAMTGKTIDEVKEAIQQAETSQTIIKYKTVVNWEKMDREEVWALIEVKLQPQREVGFDSVAERIYRFPEVRSAYLVSGAYDLAVLVTGKTMQEVAGFVSRKLSTLDHVQGTVTHFLLKRYKEDGEIFEGEERPKRQPLTL